MNENKATSLEDFEKQLKSKINNGASSLQDFESQLKKQIKPGPKALNGISPAVTPTVTNAGVVDPNKQVVKVRKNIVLSFCSDASGCGNLRNVIPMSYLTNLYGKSGQLFCMPVYFYIRQVDILARARTLYFQRQMNEEQYNIVKNYKNLQKDLRYKLIHELDDWVFLSSVPNYNFGHKCIDKNIDKYIIKIMNLMDKCCLSTEFLRKYVKEERQVESECVVLPNTVAKFFWGGVKRPDKKERIKKPKILYTGSPTHYSNELKLKGDFDNAWCDYIINAVKHDKIDFVVLGGLPWFFEEIKDKIKFHNWVSTFDYPNLVKSIRADIQIGCLTPNNFNYSKSDLKYLEASASSTPFIGTYFTNGMPSPYDNCLLKVPDNCTPDDIEEIVEKLKEPEFHNKIKNEQFDMLEREGRWTESEKSIKTWLSII